MLCLVIRGDELLFMPKILMLPPVGARYPASMFIRVDLPAPFGPKRAMIWPEYVVNDMLSTAFS